MELDSFGSRIQVFETLYKRLGLEQTLHGVRIPATVIFENNAPVAWYQTIGDAFELDRRAGKDVHPANIFSEFSRGVRTDDCHTIATFVSTINDAESVEFFDAKGLEDFLLRRMDRTDGFLQQWIESVGKCNNVVQCIWSPYVCVVSKRENIYHAMDTKRPMYERGVTYDGPVHLSVEVNIASHVRHSVRDICCTIVEHIALVQKTPVRRMVAYFKVDAAGNIWLLHCGALRTSASQNIIPLELTPRLHTPRPPSKRSVFVGIAEPKLRLRIDPCDRVYPRGSVEALTQQKKVKKKAGRHTPNTVTPRTTVCQWHTSVPSVQSNSTLFQFVKKSCPWDRVRIAMHAGVFAAMQAQGAVGQWVSLATYMLYSQQRTLGVTRRAVIPALPPILIKSGLASKVVKAPYRVEGAVLLCVESVSLNTLRECVIGPLENASRRLLPLHKFRYMALLVVKSRRRMELGSLEP